MWQVGTGDDARPYERYFFDNDVVLIGPGDDGPWSLDNPAYANRADLRSFADKAVAGDLVVARRGLQRALGLGVLGGGYDWSEAFGDREGWSLQHYWRVRWIWTGNKSFGKPVFPRSRFSESWNEEVATWATRLARRAETLDPPDPAELARLPEQERPLALSTLSKPLRSVVERAQAWEADTWDGGLGDVPSEDELLTHVTVPLLEALDWEPEQIAVKWRYTDLALFNPKRRDPVNCRVVVEGKRIGGGLRWAADQARGYAERLELRSADVLTTNGLHYRLYRPPEYADGDALWANLSRPTRSAKELFAALRRR